VLVYSKHANLIPLLGYCVAAACGCGGDNYAMRLDPPSITYDSTVVGGDTIAARFQLHNDNSRAVSILGARTGCGCTRIMIDGMTIGRDTELLVEPGQMELVVEVDTQLKSGLSLYEFELAYQHPHSNRREVVAGEVRVPVCRGVIASPSHVDISSERVGDEITIDLLDDLPRDYQIEKVEVSNPSIIAASVVEVADEHDGGMRSARPSIGDFDTRYQIRVKLLERPAAGTSHFWIRAYSSLEKLDPVEIPIKFVNVIQIQLVPDKVFAVVAPNEGVVRTITLRKDGPWQDEPTASYPEELCDVQIEPGCDPRERFVRLSLKACAVGRSFDIRFSIAGSDELVLPIQVVGKE
jgi:hypothetical protein